MYLLMRWVGYELMKQVLIWPYCWRCCGSFRDRVLPRELIVFGELGLTGELRPVANGQERLREASKHGFKHAIVPFANRPKERIGDMTIHGVKTLAAALEVVSTL